MWTTIRVVPSAAADARLRFPVKAWPSPQQSTAFSGHATARRRFLSSASRVGRDRRDADHGRARGCGAICVGRADRAHLSAGAHRKAARARDLRDRGGARHRALHHARIRRWPSGCRPNAASSAFRACRSSIRCSACSSPIWAPNPTQARRRAAHAQCRIFQAHRCAELHHAARRRAAYRRSRTCRRGADRRLAHLENTDLDLSRQSRREDRERAAGAEHAGAAAARAADEAAGGRADREPRAHRADPPEPPARPQRASRRRSLCRSPGGRRGDRVFAQALRQAQLADHRRDAPLDRGNRRRRDGAAGRTAPAGRCR